FAAVEELFVRRLRPAGGLSASTALATERTLLVAFRNGHLAGKHHRTFVTAFLRMVAVVGLAGAVQWSRSGISIGHDRLAREHYGAAVTALFRMVSSRRRDRPSIAGIARQTAAAAWTANTG